MQAKCCFCGSTNHEMAYKNVFDEGYVYNCINPVECLVRINSGIKKALTFTMEASHEQNS